MNLYGENFSSTPLSKTVPASTFISNGYSSDGLTSSSGQFAARAALRFPLY